MKELKSGDSFGEKILTPVPTEKDKKPSDQEIFISRDECWFLTLTHKDFIDADFRASIGEKEKSLWLRKYFPRVNNEMSAIAHQFHHREYQPNHVIYREGDLVDASYLVIAGSVTLYKIFKDPVTSEEYNIQIGTLVQGHSYGGELYNDVKKRLYTAIAGSAGVKSVGLDHGGLAELKNHYYFHILPILEAD